MSDGVVSMLGPSSAEPTAVKSTIVSIGIVVGHQIKLITSGYLRVNLREFLLYQNEKYNQRADGNRKDKAKQ